MGTSCTSSSTSDDSGGYLVEALLTRGAEASSFASRANLLRQNRQMQRRWSAGILVLAARSRREGQLVRIARQSAPPESSDATPLVGGHLVEALLTRGAKASSFACRVLSKP